MVQQANWLQSDVKLEEDTIGFLESVSLRLARGQRKIVKKLSISEKIALPRQSVRFEDEEPPVLGRKSVRNVDSKKLLTLERDYTKVTRRSDASFGSQTPSILKPLKGRNSYKEGFEEDVDDRRSRASMSLKSHFVQLDDDHADEEIEPIEALDTPRSVQKYIDIDNYKKSTHPIQEKLRRGRLSLREDQVMKIKSALSSKQSSQLRQRPDGGLVSRNDESGGSRYSNAGRLSLAETPRGMLRLLQLTDNHDKTVQVLNLNSPKFINKKYIINQEPGPGPKGKRQDMTLVTTADKLISNNKLIETPVGSSIRHTPRDELPRHKKTLTLNSLIQSRLRDSYADSKYKSNGSNKLV